MRKLNFFQKSKEMNKNFESRNLENKIFRKINLFCGFFLLFVLFFSIVPSLSYSSGKLIYGTNTLKNQDSRLDINSTSKEKMLSSGIATGYVNKIIEYRDIVGGFQELSDLKKISGIGEATYDKLSLKFRIESSWKQKKLKINSADDKVLKYFGFSKDEIKKLRKQQSGKWKIDSNLELMDILPQKRYEKYRDIIEY